MLSYRSVGNMFFIKNITQNQKVIRFIRGVLLLSATAILMRSVSVYFNLYLREKLGTDGVGLFTLIGSVYGFAVTFATSSINLASTRLVSECLGVGSDKAVRESMKKCIIYSLSFGISASVILMLFSYPIGAGLLGDVRTVASLRLLALTLPCIALTSAMNGYFTAVRRVGKNAAVQICEQAVRIGSTVFLLSFFVPADLEKACLCVVAGGCVSDLLAFLYSLFMYLRDMKKHIGNDGKCEEDQGKKLISIAVPTALSSYLRSGLVTAEHLLIPWGLRKQGNSREQALKIYGIMQAMALPIVMFPYALLTPFCTLLVPEISGRRASGDTDGIERTTASAFGFVLIFGIGAAGIMSCFSYELGSVIYGDLEAAHYIKLIAPLIPVMYLDTVTDSILKGMDEQLYTMRINIADAFMSVLIVFLLVPRIGIYGYIFELFFCEIVNASFSVWKLVSIVRFRAEIVYRGLFPLISIILSTSLSKLIFGFFVIGRPGVLSLTVHIGFTAALYLAILMLLELIIKPKKEKSMIL